MRYLDKLLGEANNFKLLRTLVQRGRDAEAAGDKLDNKYLAKNTKTGRFASDDRKQNKRLVRLGNAEREKSKAFTQADKLVPKVHLKGGGKGDGKPKGKLRLVQSAFYQQVGHLIAEVYYNRRDARILHGRQELENAAKLDKAAGAAIDSKERDKIFPEREWIDKLKAKKILLNKKKQINARRATTREKSQ